MRKFTLATGPLTLFASGLGAELHTLGYTLVSAAGKLRLAAHLSRWLEAENLAP